MTITLANFRKAQLPLAYALQDRLTPHLGVISLNLYPIKGWYKLTIDVTGNPDTIRVWAKTTKNLVQTFKKELTKLVA